MNGSDEASEPADGVSRDHSAGLPGDPNFSGDSPEDAAALRVRLAEMLSFLGHDAREGHSSTLALLELQRIKSDPMSLVQLAERIEANARKSLAAIDDFTQLARASGQALRPEPLDFVDLLIELVADAWPIASRAGVRLQVGEHPDSATGWADRELLTASLQRILRDGVARAARGTDILCGFQEGADWQEFSFVFPPAPDASAMPPNARTAAALPGLALAEVVGARHRGAALVRQTAHGRPCLALRLPLRRTT